MISLFEEKLSVCLCPLLEVNSGADTRDPRHVFVEQEEKDHGIYHPKLHSVPARVHGNVQSNPCASPISPHQFIYPYNGSSTVLHTTTQSHHPLEALRRLHHPTPVPNSSSSYSVSQRSTHTPSPQNASQGQKTPKTPETPASPRLMLLSSPPPPPPSPVTVAGGGRGPQTNTHYPHSVIVGGSPVSPSPSSSPSVMNMNSVSPRQRSRHPSTSLSPFSEGGGSSVGGQPGSSVSQRKKSTSSTPHSPASGGSPNPSPLFPKYKLEDILEQFKNSGNSSTNNHHLLIPINAPLLSNQSGNNTCAVSSKPSNSTTSPTPSSGAAHFDLNSAGPSSLPLGAFLMNQHHSHQSKLSSTPSFPASTLLSAAAKAQLANQITQAQNSSVASKPARTASSLEMVKEGPQASSQVMNSTLMNSPTFPTIRPPTPSLASASSILLPSSPSLAQSWPHLPAAVERSALHRKRHRRSPAVPGAKKDARQLANGLPKSPPTDAVSATAINLSTSSTMPSQVRSSSTSAVQNQSALTLENHLLHAGQTQRLPAPRQTAQLCRPPRQNEALDFTTHVTAAPLGLEPPSQPLSALLHLLSVQNAQAAASVVSSAPPQPVPLLKEENGHTNKQSSRLPPSSQTSHSNLRPPERRSPCPNHNTNPPFGSGPFPSSQPKPTSSPSSSPLGLVQSHPPSAASSPPQRPGAPAAPADTNVALRNSSVSSRRTPPPSSDKPPPSGNHLPAVDIVSHGPLQHVSAHDAVTRETGANGRSAWVDPCRSPGGGPLAICSSPKPLDLSNHVLALLAASSAAQQGPRTTLMAEDAASSQESGIAGKAVLSAENLKHRTKACSFAVYIHLHNVAQGLRQYTFPLI